MTNKTDTVGVCPECGAEIRPFQILVEYEQDDGTTGRFADCHACDEVVRPE
jgi:formate dehydrogenase maturation protein FdhE